MKRGLAPPRHLTLAITDHCNLSCRHCWPQCGPNAAAGGLEISSLRATIKNFLRLGISQLCLTGGEPLTHPGWLGLVLFACDQPELRSITLQTNSTLLTEREARELASIEHPGFSIQISLEGAAPASNDFIRGKGSFEAAWEGLTHLIAAGLGASTSVAFTEAQHNFHDIPELVIKLRELGVGGFVSHTLVIAKRARRHGLDMPTVRQYRELLARYHQNKAFRRSYEAIGNVAALEWYKGRDHPDHTPCQCGQQPYIDGHGQMFPCTMLPSPDYAVTGVHGKPAKEVAEAVAAVWTRLGDLMRQRPQRIEECSVCQYVEHCAGGCLGRAKPGADDFMRVEDRCEFRKAVYAWNPAPGEDAL
ncbi:MAG: radical SAM protein [Deltaproteobacteria bacterium]|nr:radical SAM protein [Deltaproteobacteria bacterium]